MTELVTKNELVSAETIAKYKGDFQKKLDAFKDKYTDIVYDLNDPTINKQARSDKLAIGKVISRLDAGHKEIKAPLKKLVDDIDGARKGLKDGFLSIQDGIKDQLKAHDDAIQAHAEMLQGKVEYIYNLCLPTEHAQESGEIAELLEQARLIVVDDSYELRKADATLAQVDTIKTLESRLADREKYEADQAELERLRIEAEERKRQEEHERIRKEAEARAKLEAEKALEEEKRKVAEAEERGRQQAIAAKEAADLAKKEAEHAKIKAEEDAKIKAEIAAREEREKIEREQFEEKAKADAALAKETAKKEKQAHRAKIHKRAKESFIAAGFNHGTDLVNAIKDGKIANVEIVY